MFLLEAIDSLHQGAYNYCKVSRMLLEVAALFGALTFIFYLVKLYVSLIFGLRLYVLAQLRCCRQDLVKRYGKWAVVTGATDGIGQSLAKELAARGMSILVVSRNPDKLAATKTMLEAIPNVGEVETVTLDLADSSVENFARIRQKIDPDNRDIGILINNAGTYVDRFQRFSRFGSEDLVKMANLNMLGPVHMTHIVMPGMVARGKGMVMNVSSILGAITAPYMSLYSASKAFVDAFTRQLQAEYASHPIDVVLLTPGFVLTKRLQAGHKISTNSPLSPTPDDFARSVINAMSVRCSQYSGLMLHGLMLWGYVLLGSLGVLNMLTFLYLKSGGRKLELSPVPKKRKVVAEPSKAGSW